MFTPAMFSRGRELQQSQGQALGNFTSQDSDISLRTFCADSSSPQISAIHIGHFTRTNCVLRKSPQFSAKLPQQFRRDMPNPGSQSSLVRPHNKFKVERFYGHFGSSFPHPRIHFDPPTSNHLSLMKAMKATPGGGHGLASRAGIDLFTNTSQRSARTSRAARPPEYPPPPGKPRWTTSSASWQLTQTTVLRWKLHGGELAPTERCRC